jgi:argininosuccinate lyase
MTKPRSRWNGAPAAAAMADDAAPKVWAGRLGDETSPAVEEYTAGIDVDLRLLPGDIAGSVAHAAMLRAIGVLTSAEHDAIVSGLERISDEIKRGTFAFQPNDEDIHTAVERRLIELAGPAGGKLHTGRSRNDQVATDLRLYAKGACRDLTLAIADLQSALLVRAEEHISAVMPGYTHLQRAQPVSLAHHLLAYMEMLQRDIGRIGDARARCDVMPLGSGALAGSTLPLDREAVARDLGFASVSANSIDAVADRDFAVEIAAACALLMVHLSRLCEEIVLWSTSEFGFVSLPDTHATGSSIMPQKKNPDVAELARGRTGRVAGSLTALLMMLKGLPLAYNRDLQEDKHALFDAVDVTRSTLEVLTELVNVLRFNVDAMRSAAADSALLATDVAEYLVQRGIPFRESHRIIGEMVRRTTTSGRTLADVTLTEWQAASPAFEPDVLGLFDIAGALKRRDRPGEPGPSSVAAQLERGRTLIDETRRAADPE